MMLASVMPNLLGKIDLFHFLKVISGDDLASPRELENLRKILGFLENDVFGPGSWRYLAGMAKDKQMDGFVLETLRSLATKRGLAFPEEEPSLGALYPTAVAILRTAVEKAETEVVSFRALAQCPFCEKHFGV